MNETSQLLRRYAEQRCEASFRELVTRYVDLVYSAALRQTRDRHLAEDVVQTVFIALARKAASLPPSVVLGGWLYRHTCFAASQVLRTERRRAAREKRAMETRTAEAVAAPDADWEAIAPALEEAMNSLAAPERDAILLRYFERQELRAVGTALGVSEEAARKRVSRGIEKIRGFFAKRGVTMSAGTLATLLAANAVTVAPAGLAASVAGVALAGGAVTGLSAAILKGLMLMKAKAALLAGIVLLGAAAVPLVLLDRPGKKDVAKMDVTMTQPSNPSPTQPVATTVPTTQQARRFPRDFPRADWRYAGHATPEDAFLTLFWALSNDDVPTAIESLGPAALVEKMAAGGVPQGGLAPDFRHTEGFKIIDEQVVALGQVVLGIEVTGGRTPDVKTQNLATMVLTPNGWKLDAFIPRP